MINRIKNICCSIDGCKVSFVPHPEQRLLDLLRQEKGITGVREGCGEGECGSCSVLLNNRLVNACCVPVLHVHGCSITTIEGFSKTAAFHIIADAFARAGAVQCGFCTPGFILATAALLRENQQPTDEEIRAGLSGNLCRCTGYTQIIHAVQAAAGTLSSVPEVWKETDTHPPTNISPHPLVPRTVDDSIALLQAGYTPVAGGTDLIIRQHAGRPVSANGNLFSCMHIAELQTIYRKEGRTYVGSAMPLADIIASPDCTPILREALSCIAAPGIRNIATLGGNVCNASPAADGLPVLYILNAMVHVVGPSGQRDIPLAKYIQGPGTTLLDPTEIVTCISYEEPDTVQRNSNWMFRKVGARAVNALAKVNCAALWEVDTEMVTDFRLAIGACAPTVIRSHDIEQSVIGTRLVDLPTSVDHWLGLYSELLSPLTDQRSTAEYRLHTALALIRIVFVAMG
ncbi:FAD binding domain-containing protein [Desulfogranum japonicum]|uniref:FAD binding domain-containing protein n=1 Tax=Desulfogranum japonicum TaxID=231447 RepID=UPI000401437E|nr:FAD binding domain-containing protein [Desulfogranum japonicum]